MATPTRKPTPKGCFGLLGGAIVLLVIIGLASAIGNGSGGSPTAGTGVTDTQPSIAETTQPADNPPQATEQPVVTPVPVTPAPKPVGPATTIGDGTFVVGTDIAAGTYKSTGPSPDGLGSCAWFRLKDTTGDSGTIIALDVSKGPSTVTISRSDGAFKSSGCMTWHKVS